VSVESINVYWAFGIQFKVNYLAVCISGVAQ